MARMPRLRAMPGFAAVRGPRARRRGGGGELGFGERRELRHLAVGHLLLRVREALDRRFEQQVDEAGEAGAAAPLRRARVDVHQRRLLLRRPAGRRAAQGTESRWICRAGLVSPLGIAARIFVEASGWPQNARTLASSRVRRSSADGNAGHELLVHLLQPRRVEIAGGDRLRLEAGLAVAPDVGGRRRLGQPRRFDRGELEGAQEAHLQVHREIGAAHPARSAGRRAAAGRRDRAR